MSEVEVINFATDWQVRIWTENRDGSTTWFAACYMERDDVLDAPATFYSEAGWNARFVRCCGAFGGRTRQEALFLAMNHWNVVYGEDPVPEMYFNLFDEDNDA